MTLEDLREKLVGREVWLRIGGPRGIAQSVERDKNGDFFVTFVAPNGTEYRFAARFLAW